MTRELSLRDRNGAFIRWVHPLEIDELIARGIATLEGVKRKARLVLTSTRRVSDYAEGDPGDNKYTYEESVGKGKTLVCLKRATSRGYERWDNRLTFVELRAGRERTYQRGQRQAMAAEAEREAA